MQKWLANNLPFAASVNVVTVAEMVQKLFADAAALGITSNELEQGTGNVYGAVLEAILLTKGDVYGPKRS